MFLTLRSIGRLRRRLASFVRQRIRNHGLRKDSIEDHVIRGGRLRLCSIPALAILMDSQRIELLGRNLLVSELIRAGLEVALPLRDRGVDLVVYADQASAVEAFAAVPIQMKAASERSFGIDQKYAKIANLLLVHVWNVGQPEDLEIFALRYPDAVAIAEQKGWTATASWERGGYSVSRPGKELFKLLEPYRMSREKWWPAIVNAYTAGG